ncbi:hypothetical protein GCM10009122_54540 [Fulvivirga kasyanovii]|uniref:Uncharacterized protein n=1 Tax=Fulvivirga kasyanovii TaxID=396812 RepID=A0ABW9RHQ8_9BACT|nr:hypothetical protein [Fulvivirga kasyanovii]MTI23427.1 hypothetical protein [Fulvivirga kasyanovii]
MERQNTTWEESVERYGQLLTAVNDLVRHTTQLAKSYEEVNMEFGQLIYEKGLHEIMQKANTLQDYERNFQFMYYSLRGQVEQLKHLRGVLRVLLIRDPVNCPFN